MGSWRRTRIITITVVIGASRGIGAGIARALATAGASVLILAGRDTSALSTVAAECQSLNSACTIDTQICDISSAESVAALATHIKSTHSRLDAVLINSGYSGPVTTDLGHSSPSIFASVTSTNYLGTAYCASSLLPLLVSSPRPPGAQAAFIAVGSNASFIVRGPIANTQYCVSKLAQLKLIEHVHEQYAARGLFAAAVHPGAVDSKMARETAPEEFKKFLTDDEGLCGAFVSWLLRPREGEGVRWLGGRHLCAHWDVGELLERKGEIVERDLLKAKLMV
ncbi:hypothetical protein ANO11243_093250 [Dothideomycetidae sp. 11243]|nr:hypothetical protein ANO11243_093250 [fungal sp. No.11243]